MDRLSELKRGYVENDNEEKITNIHVNENIPFISTSNNILSKLDKIEIKKNNYDECKKKLIKIKQEIIIFEKEYVSQEYYEQKKIFTDTINKKFIKKVKSMNDYKLKESEEFKKDAIRKIKIVSPNISDENLELAIRYPDEFVKQKITSNEPDNFIVQKFKETKEKYSEIIILENQIKELHDLFLDFALIVEDQGKKLDNIEKNVIDVSEEVYNGNKLLEISLQIQKQIRKKQFCCFMVIFLMVLIIIAVVVSVISFQKSTL